MGVAIAFTFRGLGSDRSRPCWNRATAVEATIAVSRRNRAYLRFRGHAARFAVLFRPLGTHWIGIGSANARHLSVGRPSGRRASTPAAAHQKWLRPFPLPTGGRRNADLPVNLSGQRPRRLRLADTPAGQEPAWSSLCYSTPQASLFRFPRLLFDTEAEAGSHHPAQGASPWES